MEFVAWSDGPGDADQMPTSGFYEDVQLAIGCPSGPRAVSSEFDPTDQGLPSKRQPTPLPAVERFSFHASCRNKPGSLFVLPWRLAEYQPDNDWPKRGTNTAMILQRAAMASSFPLWTVVPP